MKNQISKIKIKKVERIKPFFFRNFAFCILILTAPCVFQQKVCGNESHLTINLPAEITIEDENVTLGQIAEIKGDEILAAQAKKIGLGKITSAGQTITIDRTLVLIRLMCTDGLNQCKPEFLGSEKVKVSRAARIIKGESFIESAQTFLKNSIKDKSIARWEPTQTPADLVLTADLNNIELVPHLVSRNTNGQINLEIIVKADGIAVANKKFSFRPTFNVRQAITTKDVKKGEPFTFDNIRIEQTISKESQPVDWTEPTGLIAAQDVPAGTILKPAMAKTPAPKITIERNQTVVIRVDNQGLTVTALGNAIQSGNPGDCIKVRNIDSQRIIMAKVNEDGTVEPVL